MSMPRIIAETERLILRPFRHGDIRAIFLLNSIPEILTYIPTALFTNIEQAESLLVDVIYDDYEQRGFGRWAVEHKADKRVIGFCGPKYLTEFNEVELGYRYLPEYWRQGIGVEAANAALTEMSKYGINEAIALILEGNVGSEAVAKRVGMQWREINSYMGHKVNVYHKHFSA